MATQIRGLQRLGSSVRIAALLSWMLLAAAPVLAAERHRVFGHVPAAVARLSPLGYLERSNRLNLAIGLPLRHRNALTNLLEQLYNPASPLHHQYLTPQQFTERFGPTEEDYRALVGFASANGLTVTARHPNRLLLDVSASVADLEKAFQVRMQVYQHPNKARTFYAPDGEPSLDLPLPVVFIGGLDTFELPQPMHLRPSPMGQSPNPKPNAGSSPTGSYMGYDFRNAYAPGVSAAGAGQTVALLEFDGFYPSDITAYETLAGLPNVPLQTVLVGGFNGVPATSLGNLEVSLDIELVISMAPGLARVLVYEAPPNGLAADILSRMASDNLAKQISSSWTWNTYDPNSEAIFLQFAAQGQTYFNATGDHDAFVGSVIPSPADDPYVVLVGGTTLTMNGAGVSYASETVWNRGNGVGTSGGISATYPIPTWQQGVSMSTNLGSTTMRNVPDVAIVADGFYVKHGNGSSGTFGGTSGAAPLWAAFTALMNQQAVSAGRPAVGFINPDLYRIGTNASYTSGFHDITVGDNTWSSSPSRFFAVPGYDLCTGWGSPTGSNLINAVAGPPLFVPLILSSTLALVAETCTNGAVDPGETVTVSLGLKNIGLADTTNLVATLQTTGGVVLPSGPAGYGVLTVGGPEVTRLFTFGATGICGATNSATLQLQDGAANLGTVTFSFVMGQPGGPAIFSENFDGVGAPALPAGWTVSWSGGGAAWATTSAQSDTSPNSVFAPDPGSISDNRLTSPPFTVAASSAQLTFRHSINTEVHYDGAVLEISVGGGAFTDIITAGGSFVTNGYNQNIPSGFGNPLAGRAAWSTNSGGFITTVVNLPAAAAGQTNSLRWRLGSDSISGRVGWYIDTISVTPGYTCCTSNHPPTAVAGVLTSSSNPALPTLPVTFTLTLGAVPPAVGVPTGGVQFRVDGTNAGAPAPLVGGTARYTNTTLAHGPHTVGAEYAGDPNFIGTTNQLAPDQLINTQPVPGPNTIERDPTNGVKVAIATLLANDADADGDPLSFLGVSATSVNGGIVVSNGGWVFYTPPPGFTNADAFTYTIGDGLGTPVTGVVTVNIRVDNGPSQNLVITVVGNGAYAVRGSGIPDRTYRIQFAEDMGNPSWHTLGTATADPTGIFEFLDASGSPQRFYRSVYP